MIWPAALSVFLAWLSGQVCVDAFANTHLISMSVRAEAAQETGSASMQRQQTQSDTVANVTNPAASNETIMEMLIGPEGTAVQSPAVAADTSELVLPPRQPRVNSTATTQYALTTLGVAAEMAELGGRTDSEALIDEGRPRLKAMKVTDAGNLGSTLPDEKVAEMAADALMISIPAVRWYHRHMLKHTPLETWRIFWEVPLHALLFLAATVVLLVWFDRVMLRAIIPQSRLHAVFWIGMAVAIFVYITYVFGKSSAEKWASGYVYEWIFCIDDLFIYHFIFKQYKMPKSYASKALRACLVGQIITRFLFYIGLAHLVRSLPAIQYIAGAALVYNGMQALLAEDETNKEGNEVDTWLVKSLSICLSGRLLNGWGVDAFDKQQAVGASGDACSRSSSKLSVASIAIPSSLPNTPRDSIRFDRLLISYDTGQFFVVTEDGIYMATLLLPVVMTMILTDAVLGADCSIAKIEELDGPFWNLSSAIIALFGIRSCYVYVASLANNVSLIKYAIASVLVFMGFELLTMNLITIGTMTSLAVITFIFLVTFLISTARSCTDAPIEEYPPCDENEASASLPHQPAWSALAGNMKRAPQPDEQTSEG
eukprot:TRINITY_DN101905_c0_g1_i1.p1 TRINITY_DN101905_c0_g1~~TRINITY_DN101905_c0_g1_i1.p1  ORF type:complete len:598 (-),score=86.47 TRINITY_DN101905_c0_g1_i1:160-1953(-)